MLEVSEPRLGHVDRVLAGFFSDSARRAGRIGAEYVTLWRTIESSSGGGKRFRPRLAMAAYEGLGGTDIEVAAHVAAAVELLHTALIVHDDVIDRDFVRRGGPNVSGHYRDAAQTAGIPIPDAEHRGMSVAIIAGDLALTGAHRLIERSGADPWARDRLLDLLDEAIFASAAGELIDVDFSMRDVTPEVDEILDMERLKTAVYSFETPLRAGAVLAGADDETVAGLGRFGSMLGTAYQLVDDLLGVFGDERATGKTTIGDLREGKQTVLVAYASRCPEWQEVADLFGRPDLSDDDAERVRRVLDECGARGYVERLAAEYGNRAWETLARTRVPDALVEELRPMVATVLERVR